MEDAVWPQRRPFLQAHGDPDLESKGVKLTTVYTIDKSYKMD